MRTLGKTYCKSKRADGNSHAINVTIATRFIRALCGSDETVCFQTFGEGKHKLTPGLKKQWHASFQEALPELRRLNNAGAGIYVTVNATDGRGRKTSNIVRVRALFVDVDGNHGLPNSWPIEPDIIVQRDETHWHAYWLLNEAMPLPEFRIAQQQLAKYYDSDTAVCDLPRVMRVPGFLHHKGEPTMVRLVKPVKA